MAVIEATIQSDCLLRAVHITALIPVEKQNEKAPFKTLYLLHGMTGCDKDYLLNTKINIWARENGIAVIMPSCENSFYINGPLLGSDYGKFIGKELVDITRNLFPLSHKREDTFIAGLSMGGFGALRNGLYYHDTFSHIAGYSSALHIFKIHEIGQLSSFTGEEKVMGNYDDALKSDKNPEVLMRSLAEEHSKNPKVELPKIYLSCGTKDPFYKVNIPFRDELISLGYDVTWNESDHGHEWDFWNQELYNTINWLTL